MSGAHTALVAVDDTLALVAELTVYVAVGWWGWTRRQWPKALRVLAAAGAVALFAVVWSLFGAPSGATWPAHGWGRVALELVWFGGGAAALAVTRGRRTALLFVGVWLLADALLLLR